MAIYLTNDTDLTSVADAIRTKGSTTDALVYPDGFVTAINNLPDEPEFETKTVTPSTEQQIVTADEGYDGLSGVIVEAVPTETKSMALGADAPSTVVNTDGKFMTSVSPSIDTSVIKAENIAEGVTMLGIEGTHSGGGWYPSLYITAPTGSTVTITNGTKTYTPTEESGTWTQQLDEMGTWTVTAVKGITSASKDVVVSVATQYDVDMTYPSILITAPTGSTVTVTDGTTTLTPTESSGTWSVDVYLGTWTVKATKGTSSASTTVTVAENKQYTATLAYVEIYGVTWDGTSTTALSRTDSAAGFTNPSPAISNGNGSSPFDNIYPWSGMLKSENSAAGTVVAIPKFYYQLTKSGNSLSIKISKDKVDDTYYISPAHMDRGDGTGERDVVYVGAYHCGATAYKSVSGQKPKASVTRSSFRSSIHSLGTTVWQWDWLTRFTIWLLYIVEYADWNSQEKIGYGCGNGSSTVTCGQCDSMTYHTGTSASSRTTYGYTRYRYIEGLWDNVFDWVDGCYNSSSGLMLIKNPSSFSDSANGTSIGTPAHGFPSALGVSTTVMPIFYPTTSSGSYRTYVPDYWYFDSSYPCVCSGGYYVQDQGYGLFYWYCGSASYTRGPIGSRLMVLP